MMAARKSGLGFLWMTERGFLTGKTFFAGRSVTKEGSASSVPTS
jgi:hypothetical protein